MTSTYEQSQLDYVSGNIVTNLYHAAMLGVDRVLPQGVEVSSLEQMLSKGSYSHGFHKNDINWIMGAAKEIRNKKRSRMRGHNERYSSKISEVQMAIDMIRLNYGLEMFRKKLGWTYTPKVYFYRSNGLMDVCIHENKSKKIREFMIFKRYEPGKTASLRLSKLRDSISVYNFNENAIEAVVMVILGEDTFRSNSYKTIRHQTYQRLQKAHNEILESIKRDALFKDEPNGFVRFLNGQNTR